MLNLSQDEKNFPSWSLNLFKMRLNFSVKNVFFRIFHFSPFLLLMPPCNTSRRRNRSKKAFKESSLSVLSTEVSACLTGGLLFVSLLPWQHPVSRRTAKAVAPADKTKVFENVFIPSRSS